MKSINFTDFNKVLVFVLPVGIALLLWYPLVAGEYYYPYETNMYMSFMMNFIESLRNFELPVWNEYVGSGHPSMYFGHYPITQNTIFYMIFGYSDSTYYFTKFTNMAILLLGFIYACKLLKLGYLYALAGALVYFCVNFVLRIMINDTIGNLYPLYPILVILVLHIVSSNKKSKRDIMLFSLVYIFWLSGGHGTFIMMPLVMLSIVFFISILFFHKKSFRIKDLRKYAGLYIVLFIVPMTAVFYQYYFIYDVVVTSNRITEGLIISPLELTAWKQLSVSFQSSSYFWIGLWLLAVYLFIRFLKLIFRKYRFPEPRQLKVPLWSLLIIMPLVYGVIYVVLTETELLRDYACIITSKVFIAAVVLYFLIYFVSRKRTFFLLGFRNLALFVIYVSMLSYYFYSPENIIGDVNGYDYDLFRELGTPLQLFFILSVLFSIEEYREIKIVKIMVLSLIVLYLFRSHFTIPLMRFTGIVWYATRDGTVFSLFFAILFMYGLRRMLLNIALIINPLFLSIRLTRISDKINKSGTVSNIINFLLIVSVALLVMDSYNKLYKGTNHRYIFPKNRETAVSPREKGVINAMDDYYLLKDKLLELNSRTKHFFRMFTPENSYYYIAGTMQAYKMHEAAIYESSISQNLQEFYDHTILGKEVVVIRELKDAMPYFLFTRHIHEGIGLSHREITYRSFFNFSPNEDHEYIKNQNIELLWDLMQVKYLIVGPVFSKALDEFTDREQYRLISKYPNLGLNLYEILKEKNYSRFAVLPLDDRASYDEILQELNSRDINKLKALYSQLVFLDKDSPEFNLAKTRRDSTTRYYEVESSQNAVFIEFESWNRNWELKVNSEERESEKAFQLFKAAKIMPGLNRIEFTYNFKYFTALFCVGMVTTLLYAFLLLWFWREEKKEHCSDRESTAPFLIANNLIGYCYDK